MKCFFHESRDAVATCQKCGKSLCKECASKYIPVLCDDCFAAEQNQKAAKKQADIIDTWSEFFVACAIGLGAAIVCFIVSKQINGGTASYNWILNVLTRIWVFTIPFGWKFFNYLLGKMHSVFIMPLIVSLIIQTVFSFFTGPFCFVYQLIKTIIKAKLK